MMDCPRCGFAQPQDRYCASCGLDVEHFVAKPKPLWVRLAQNSTLHLSLIGILIVLVIGYIFYTRSELVQREMGAFLSGRPLSSRDAGDPDDNSSSRKDSDSADVNEGASSPEPAAAMAMVDTGNPAGTGNASDKIPDVQKLEVSSWEIPHEALANLLIGAEKAGESNAGHAHLWTQGLKISEAIQAASKHIGKNRSVPMTMGQQIVLETPATTSEAFQFGLFFQITKVEGKDVTVKWASSLVLPQPETPAEAASQTPVVKALNEATLNGLTGLTPNSAFLIVFEPLNRTPREEYVTKAGEGPWSVFSSDEFRAGTTDWVVLVQLR